MDASSFFLEQNSESFKSGKSPWLMNRKKFYTPQAWTEMLHNLANTKTLYVGNLSLFTTEEQMYEFFSRAAPVKRVIVGLNSKNKEPCGFCFVEYHTHKDAVAAKKCLSGTKLDERVVRADLDPGFNPGRQYGRSKRAEGKIRDDFRTPVDQLAGGVGSMYENTYVPVQTAYQKAKELNNPSVSSSESPGSHKKRRTNEDAPSEYA
jgi:RNA recognition motif-containing protein